MEILLLLSAFLTALTGAITGARPVQAVAAAQVSGCAADGAVAARGRAAAAATRMTQGWLPLIRRIVIAPLRALAVDAAPFEQRRRL